MTLEAFVQAFRTLGYEPCGDGELQEGLEKVALYTKNGVPTYAARQDAKAHMWLSKLGSANLAQRTISAIDTLKMCVDHFKDRWPVS